MPSNALGIAVGEWRVKFSVVKCRFWFSRSVVGPESSVFPTSSQVIPVFLFPQTHFEKQGLGPFIYESSNTVHS